MQQLIIAAIILLLPLIMVVLLRTNAAILFFVLTGAATLQSYLDRDVASFAGALLPGKSTQGVSLGLFIFPFFVAAFAFRHTVSKSMLFFHIVLAVLVGAAFVFISPQFLPASVVATIRSSGPYHQAEPYTSLIIAAAFLASVAMIWLSHPKTTHDKRRGH